MSFDLIRVMVFGRVDDAWADRVRLAFAYPGEADDFDIRMFATDDDLPALLADWPPQVIVSFGEEADFPNLQAAPLEIRKRWMNTDDLGIDPAQVAWAVLQTFLANATDDPFPEVPLVSVFTPTYLTGDKIRRPLESLLAQTYPNWEWVLFDDSPDDGETFAAMCDLAETDQRISAYTGHRASGNIGDVKRRACGLCRGQLLVELDHDDALTPQALEWLVQAWHAFPDAGFFYSDYAEVFETGESATYGDDWAFGYGGYRTEELGGRSYAVAAYPDVNAKTIRHIVGVPNHYRAWTREAYWACGGHSPEIHVADDYELLLRTFLTTRMVHIRKFGYIQYMNVASSGNTQRARNREIQRLVRHFAGHYADRIHARFEALGVDDFIWRDGELDWDTPNPNPTPIANYVFDGA